MFGQPNSSPFGSPQPTGAFGQTNTAPGFGSPAPAPFGAPAPAFGGGGGFGSPAPAPGGFGAPGASSGFGQTNTFGGGSAFGGGGGGFGAPAPAPGGFGSAGGGFGAPAQNASPFGAAPAPSGGLFGAPAPAPSGGLFGSSGTQQTGFGGTAGGFGGSSGFGGAPSGGFGQQTSAFGAPAPPTGLFGASAPAPAFGATGGFGATSTFGAPAPAPPGGSIFGSPAPAPSTGLFGSSPGVAGQQQGQGTKIAPFQPTNRQDGNSTITMQSISAMDAYQNKSFEELRFEDYSQGNRGTGTGAAAPAAGGFGGFGAAPAPAGGGIFGSNAPAPFGAPAPAPAFGAGGFGSPAPAPFGAPAPAPAFGAPGGFGSPAPAPGGFGANAFGKPASGSLFGAAPAPSGNLFGSSPAPAPGAFGAPAPAGGIFGSNPAPAPSGGIFGSSAPAPQGGLFGNSPAPAFGAPAPAPGAFGFSGAPAPSGNLFGTPAPAPGAFGAPAPGAFGAQAPGGFGAPPSSGSLFGSTPAPSGNFFGSSGGNTNLFGPPAPAPSGSFFGSPAPAPGGSLFGAPQPAPAAGVPPAGSIIPPAANEVLAHQIQALENKRKEMQKLDVWRGKSSEDSSIVPASQPEYDGGMSGVLPSNSHYSPYHQSPRSTTKIRPRGFGAATSPTPTSAASPALNNIGTGGRPMMSPDAYAASSVKRLVIKPGSLTPKPKMRLRLANSPANGDSTKYALPVPLDATSPPGQNGLSKASPGQTPMGKQTSIPVYGRDEAKNFASPKTQTNGSTGKASPPVEDITPPPDPAMDYYQQIIASPDGVPTTRKAPISQVGQKKKPAYVPKLTKAGYVVSPSLERLASMSEADLASVSGFSIRHDPYGLVEWEGAVDVRYADIDKSIVIGQADVSVYTVDEEEGQKPEVGSKLNRPARITFRNVFPPKGGRDADAETKEKFAKKITKSTSKMSDAELISYNKETGEWKIRVVHFSRYGLLDDSDEEEDSSNAQGTPEKHDIDVDPWLGDEDGMDDAAVVSDIEVERENMEKETEAAYFSLFEQAKMMAVGPPVEPLSEEMPEEDFADEGEHVMDDGGGLRRMQVSEEDYLWSTSGHASSGICGRLASKAFAGERRVPSSTDCYKIGRRFGIAWSPNGSFCFVKNGPGTLVRCRPVFNEVGRDTNSASVKYLEVHKSSATKVPTSVDDRSPRFVLPMGIGNSGDSSSHNALHKTLENYESASQACKISKLVFALLACLVDNPESVERSEANYIHRSRDVLFNARRKEAILRFLVYACQSTVDSEIHTSLSRKDKYGAIFSALTGGNLARACSIAVEMGESDLAACLATFDVEGTADILEQVRLAASGSAAKIPIYKLLTGNVEDEETACRSGASSIDWMRRLVMRLLYNAPHQADKDVSDVLDAFNQDVVDHTAPFPKPFYHGSDDGVECILYRLLRLTSSQQKISCLEVIDPRGSSRSPHDFTLAFHVSSVLSAAMGICPSLEEEERLLSGYVAQLLDLGHWEWAVYICLCSLSPGTLESSPTEWKRQKAKEIILRNFVQDPNAVQRRKFLEEEVGAPREWLNEALAARSVSSGSGDPFEYIKYLSFYDRKEAASVVEQVIIPNSLFLNNNDQEKCKSLLESFSGLSPLSSALLNLFDLADDVNELVNVPNGEAATERLPEMFETCQEIEKTLLAHRAENIKMKDVAFKFGTPNFDIIPFPAMLSEALERLSFLRLQLKAIEKGVPVDADVSRKKLKSQLLAMMDEYSDDFYGANIVRALR